jgi:hypothetical protein
MKELWLKYKLYIIGAGILLAAGIAALVYYAILAKGKKLGTSSVLADIPNPSVGGAYSESEKLAIRTYTTWLESEVGVNSHFYTVHNDSQWSAFALESDRILVGCFNQYAKDYPGANLYSDIMGTYFWTTSDPSTVTSRLQKALNL